MDIFSAYSDLGVRAEIWALLEDLEEHLQPFYAEISQVETLRQLHVLRAFQNNYLCEAELHGSTGYGYHDAGRDKLEQAFAESLEAEAAFCVGSLPRAVRCSTRCSALS